MLDDNRAVSIAVTHGLTIAITAVLISGLLLSSGQLLESQEQEVAEKQFEEIGGDIVSHINSLDRLNGTGEDVEASVQPSYPERVAGNDWNIELSDGPNPFGTTYALNISSSLFDRTIQYPVETKNTDIDGGASARGDNPEIRLCADGTITLGDCP